MSHVILRERTRAFNFASNILRHMADSSSVPPVLPRARPRGSSNFGSWPLNT